jgi:hypothetical protein
MGLGKAWLVVVNWKEVRSARNVAGLSMTGLQETIVQTAMAAIPETCLRANAGGVQVNLDRGQSAFWVPHFHLSLSDDQICLGNAAIFFPAV